MRVSEKDETILITGGTGTFGKNFIDYCLTNEICFRKIIVLSRDENKQFHMKIDLDARFPSNNVNFLIGDIRDCSRLETAFHNVDYVINAAALKHVPVCEYNPQEAIKTNVTGMMNICEAASRTGVKKVIQLSTDKACEPINLYGSTKQLAEKYVIHANNFSFDTKLSAVRYGNIIGSRGSIIETILNNIQLEKPIKITDLQMTRFWLPIQTAIEMVLWTLRNMIGGEIVIPKAKSSYVVDIAESICSLYGKKFNYELVGSRSGEKIHEQLLARNEFSRANISNCEKYVIVSPENPVWDALIPTKLSRLHKNPMTLSKFSSEDFLINGSELDEFIKPFCHA